MQALIDGDLVCYRCAAVTEKAAEGIARWQADEMLSRILEETDASDWRIFLSGENNFRYKLYPDYKANRRDMVRPKWLEVLREHLVIDWNATVTDGIEADDALGITSQSPEAPECVVCSIDKDLRQLPGQHYHFVNRQWLEISPIDAYRNFYCQLLVGDASDNIRGCSGFGPVKSQRAVEYLTSADSMYSKCKEIYLKAGHTLEEMHLNAQLLYIHRREGDSWTPPVEKQEEAQKPLSSDNMTITSSEPTTA